MVVSKTGIIRMPPRHYLGGFLMSSIKYSRFKSFLVVERGIMPDTANDYLATIRRFHESTGIAQPVKDDVVNYIMEFHEKGYSYSHIVNTTLALERYTEFLGNPFRLDRPRKPRTKVEDWLTEQEIARIFVSCKSIREQCIIALLAYTGIRNKELCNLKVRDVNFESQTVFIKAGKGLKDGTVCIAPVALDIVYEYLKAYDRQPNETILFSITGSRKGEKMRTGAIRKHVKKLAKRAGIERRVYPHLFRHSLAMNLLLKGADVYTVKEQLRHEFISTTERYLKSSPDILGNNYPIFVPQYVWGYSVAKRQPNCVFAGSSSIKFNK